MNANMQNNAKNVILDNIRKIRAEIPKNPFGENVRLVAATKTRSIAEILSAIEGGVDAIAENRAQEFRDKNELLPDFPKHFIGRLQENKLKYLIGKVDLIHSCDSQKLAEAISEASLRRGVSTNVLLEINIGNEASKGGFSFDEAEKAYNSVCALPMVKPCGLMAMLPREADEEVGAELVQKMRAFLDKIRRDDPDFNVLSMGMSGDYRLCVQNGSNMVRIGTGIFGERT